MQKRTGQMILRRRIAVLEKEKNYYKKRVLQHEEVRNQLETAFTAAGVNTSIIDAGYTIRYVDSSWERRHGPAQGKKCYSYFRDRQSVCPRCALTKAIRTKKIVISEVDLFREGNRPALTTIVPFRDKHKRWLFAEIITDLKERRRVEDELARSYREYDSLAENFTGMVYRVDPVTLTTTYVSKAIEKLFGYSKAQWLKDKNICRKIFHPQDMQRVFTYVRRVVKARQSGGVIEYRIVTKDGRVRWVEDRFSCQKNERGAVISLVGIVNDVTERKVMEQQLQYNEALQRALLAAFPDIVFLVDRAQYCLYCNAAAATFLGTDVSSIIGKKCDTFLPADIVRDYWPALRKVFATGKPFYADNVEARVARTVWFDGQLIPVKNSGGEVTAVLGIIRDVTEQRKAQRALADREAQFKSIAESSPNLIFIHAKGAIVYVNRRSVEVMGYREREFYAPGFNFLDLVAQESRPLARETFALHMRGKDVPDREYVLLTKSGRRLNVILATKLMPYRGERAILGIITDITPRIEIEKKLADSESLYRELVERAHSIILKMDRRGRVTFFNEFAQKFFGFSEKEIIGKSVMGTIVPRRDSSGKNLGAMIAHLLSNPESYTSNENENMKKSGERVVISWYNRNIRNERGDCVGVLSVGHDITARKRMEQQLYDSESKLKALIENAPTVTILKDTAGQCVFRTKNAAELIDALRAHSQNDFLAELSDGLSSMDTRVIRQRCVATVTHQMVTAEGERTFEVSKYPVAGPRGDILYVCMICRDISERLKLLKAKEDLIRNVSHELKTPVAMMQMAHEMCDRGLLRGDMEQARRAQRITRYNLERLRRDVGNILDSFILSSRRPAVKTEACALPPLLRRIIADQANEVRIKRLVVRCRFPGPLVVPCSERDMHILFNNIFENAVKFTNRGMISIDARARGSQVYVRFSDTGVGFSPETKKQLFEKFYKGNPAARGTGLGLAICKEIVTRYGGAIDIVSDGKGKGAVVTVILPGKAKNKRKRASAQDANKNEEPGEARGS